MRLQDIKEKAKAYYSADNTNEYKEFEEKFNPKRTTDDCFTPDCVYNVVAEYVADKYKRDKAKFIRPFYPGGDYQSEDYPEGCTVVDNPPFSIFAQIVKWYSEREIDFFLFAQTKTVMQYVKYANILFVGADVKYDNGAIVQTSFVTNLGEFKVKTAPILYKKIKEEQQKDKNSLLKYTYPDNILTFSPLCKLTAKGIEFGVKADECMLVRALDNQRPKKQIYGAGVMISDIRADEFRTAKAKAKAEKPKAEKPTIVWELSERERKIIEQLGRGREDKQ